LHEREKRGLFSYSMLGIIGRGKNILDVHMGTHTHTHTHTGLWREHGNQIYHETPKYL